ncbi:hypothetical protein AB0H88_14500 [Nonomuraea sp. NPDC050680]|uniref:hypothetical protein n=1 Tax=Nonomuraea sp. NPDC050680 TaxID=3154630 RepID=UPI00340674B1
MLGRGLFMGKASQAALAGNFPEGKWASGPSIPRADGRSALTCSCTRGCALIAGDARRSGIRLAIVALDRLEAFVRNRLKRLQRRPGTLR